MGQLWLAGVFPGLLLALPVFDLCGLRCKIQPHLGPALSKEERNVPLAEKLKLLTRRHPPFNDLLLMMGLFVMGVTSLVERLRQWGRFLPS